MLTGSVPDWLKGDNIDLSYNDFTTKSAAVSCEPQGGLSVSCLKIAKCPKTWYSLHINCGGKEATLSELWLGESSLYYLFLWERRSKAAYSQEDIDVVRTEWAKFVVKTYM